MNSTSIWALILISLLFYFLPSFIAWARHHHNSAAIFIVNLLLGFSMIGWIIALVWAFSNPSPIIYINRPDPRI
jgi:hypothetical protein